MPLMRIGSAARVAAPRLAARSSLLSRPVACARWQRAGERAEGAGAAPVLHASFSTSAVAKSEDESTLPAELKTGGPGYGLTLGIVGAGYIMNQEMYVINDETMLAAGWLGLMAIFVNMGSASVTEMLDTRAKEIETALVEQRQAEQDAVGTMIAKAQDAISVNEELIAVCDPANFDAWTALKMEKTLQKAKNDSATATLRKLAEVQRIEDAAARRKLASIIAEVNAGVEAAIDGDKNFASKSIDEAIASIPKATAN